ncbi:MAG: sigma-54 dependent transcriptional regulator [Pontixanthobacter sp.]
MTSSGSFELIFVEDDDALRQAMVQALQLEGISVAAFAAAAPALHSLNPDFAGVVVSDIRLPGMDGLEFFKHIHAIDPELPVILTTGHGDVSMAVGAMKNGAADFLTKPYSGAQLIEAARNAAEKRLLIIENRKLRSALFSREQPKTIGSSDFAQRLRRLISDVAAVDFDLMIAGESGTGKNFVAQQIHALSARRDRPFVTVDAGTVMHEDAELIIFGRAPGNALSRSGLIEKANGGTLFLDEIESMPAAFQARLLNLIERRTIQSIGSDREQPVNIRVIAASRMADGKSGETTSTASSSHVFAPLFHRLSGISIKLTPITERADDIYEFFRHFLLEFEDSLKVDAKTVTQAEWHHLATHDWSGNLWELRAFARNFVLGLTEPIFIGSPGQQGQSLNEIIAHFEKAVLSDALQQRNGRVVEAASALNIPRKTLYDRLAKYGLNPRDFRPPSSKN